VSWADTSHKKKKYSQGVSGAIQVGEKRGASIEKTELRKETSVTYYWGKPKQKRK